MEVSKGKNACKASIERWLCLEDPAMKTLQPGFQNPHLYHSAFLRGGGGEADREVVSCGVVGSGDRAKRTSVR